jgi:hypothetical protein
MRRRKFIALLGGAVAAWSLAARAQHDERVRRIGVLLPAAADDMHYQTRLGAFLQGLAQSGWNIGQNVRIDTRWATASADAVRRSATELVALAPDVILAPGASTVGPLLQVTRTVPSWLSYHLIKEKIPVIYQRAFDYYRRTWGERLEKFSPSSIMVCQRFVTTRCASDDVDARLQWGR